jgi:hypothetical protein
MRPANSLVVVGKRHPPLLWITLWVTTVFSAEHRKNARDTTDCLIFEQKNIF